MKECDCGRKYIRGSNRTLQPTMTILFFSFVYTYINYLRLPLTSASQYRQSLQERPQYRASVPNAYGGRNKDGFNNSNNNNYSGSYRKGDRDQGRDGRGHSNNRDYNNPNYRKKGSGDYKPNYDRNSNNTYRQRQQGDVEGTITESSQQSTSAAERPKLALKPRTTPAETGPNRDPNIFGIGKAREAQEDSMIEKLDLNDPTSSEQLDIDKDVTMDDQTRTYTNKSKLPIDKKFSQDRSKGGGRGNSRGRDRKSRNNDDGGKSTYNKVNRVRASDSYVLIVCTQHMIFHLIIYRHSKLKIDEVGEHNLVNLHQLFLKL